MSEHGINAFYRFRAQTKAGGRREKQRQTNIDRAHKMHLAQVEGEVAPVRPVTVFKGRRTYIGCSGWFYWHWRGAFYPAELPTNRWFQHYASRFKTVELNGPYYSWPTVATVRSWIRQAGRSQFVYTVKVCELITHVKRFTGTKQMVGDLLPSEFDPKTPIPELLNNGVPKIEERRIPPISSSSSRNSDDHR